MNPQFWNERYRAEAYAYGREPNDFLREVATRIPKGRVLCLAEGEGRNAVYLASLGYEVTALDFSEEGLRKATALAQERGVTIRTVCANLATYRFDPSSFAGVVAIWAHLPQPVRAEVHAGASRALIPNGVFVLEAYTPRQLAFDSGGPRDVSLLMTLEDLTRELEPLTLDIGREVERVIDEGEFHRGPSATVQVLARRAGV